MCLITSFTELLHPHNLLCCSVLQSHLADPSQQSKNSSGSLLLTLSKTHIYKAGYWYTDPPPQTERASPLSGWDLPLTKIYSDEENFTQGQSRKKPHQTWKATLILVKMVQIKTQLKPLFFISGQRKSETFVSGTDTSNTSNLGFAGI